MSNITKVCGWCGQLLDHWGEPPEGPETCEHVYGEACKPALDYYQSQINYDWQEQHPDYIDEGRES